MFARRPFPREWVERLGTRLDTDVNTIISPPSHDKKLLRTFTYRVALDF